MPPYREPIPIRRGVPYRTEVLAQRFLDAHLARPRDIHPQSCIARALSKVPACYVEILQQNVDAAFTRLIALIKRTAGDDRSTLRTRLIELFDLFDPADPEVIAGRRNLANALY